MSWFSEAFSGKAQREAAALQSEAYTKAAEEQSAAFLEAAQIQADASQYAADMSMEQYEQSREDLAPWRETGETALTEYAQLMGLGDQPADYSSFETSPGYLFRQEEGIKAIERSQASQGLLQSGGTAKALQKYGQGLASEEYNSYLNNLSGLAGLGYTATTQTAVLGQEATNTSATALQAGAAATATGLTDSAAARASGYLGSAQAEAQGMLASSQAKRGLFGDIASLGGFALDFMQNQKLISALG